MSLKEVLYGRMWNASKMERTGTCSNLMLLSSFYKGQNANLWLKLCIDMCTCIALGQVVTLILSFLLGCFAHNFVHAVGLSTSLFNDVNSFVMDKEDPAEYVPAPAISAEGGFIHMYICSSVCLSLNVVFCVGM